MATLNGGEPMIVSKLGRRAAAVLLPTSAKSGQMWGTLILIVAVLLWSGCGDVFRPVANPILKPGGDPLALALAVVVNFNNGAQGSTTQIDASGDTNIGNFQVGAGPVHAAYVGASNSRALVANRSSDSVSGYTPSVQGSAVSTLTLPAGSAPVFVTAPTITTGYVANSGTNTLGVLDLALGIESAEVPVGVTPVAVAVTPDNNEIFVANKGSGTVSILKVSDRSTVATVTVGTAPVWLAVKGDSTTVYVANQGSGTVSVIDVPTSTVVATLTVGASPRMLLYDARLRRLYVVSTGANTLSVFNADPQIPTLLKTVTVGTAPSAVTALADGTRLYVSNSGCADPVNMTACTGNTVTVVDSTSLAVRKTITVGSTPIWLDSSADSTKVVVANRDSNNISDIRTQDDTVVATNASASPSPVFLIMNR